MLIRISHYSSFDAAIVILPAEEKTQQLRKVYLNNKDERRVKSSVKHIHSLLLKSNY
jgi:hypothetical protein